MQYQVPQFIETEDKIVGPFTLRQFIYVAIAAGLGFFLYFTLRSPAVAIMIGAVLAGSATALGFMKYEGQPLPKVLVNAFNFIWKPQMYVWQPENPDLPKNAATVRSVLGGGIDLEKIIAGFALKKAWQNVSTGSPPPSQIPESGQKTAPRQYQTVRSGRGDRRVARRVDYI